MVVYPRVRMSIVLIYIHISVQSILACDKPFWSQIRARASSPRTRIVQDKSPAGQSIVGDVRDDNRGLERAARVVPLWLSIRRGIKSPSRTLRLFRCLLQVFQVCSVFWAASLLLLTHIRPLRLRTSVPLTNILTLKPLRRFSAGPVCHSDVGTSLCHLLRPNSI